MADVASAAAGGAAGGLAGLNPATIGIAGGLAAFNAIRGGIQAGQAKRGMEKMWREDAKIPLYDPMQQAALQKIRRQESYFRAGADPNTALANRLAGQAAAQTQANLMRGGGPGLVQNLLSSQRVAGDQYAQIGANAAAAANQMLPMELGLVGEMAKRAYDRQRYKRDVYFAQAAQKQQDANRSINAAISSAGNILAAYSGPAGAAKSAAAGSAKAVTAPSAGVNFRSATNPFMMDMSRFAQGIGFDPSSYSLGSIGRANRPATNFGLGYTPQAPSTNFGLLGNG